MNDRGRHVKRIAAVAWLAEQPWFRAWPRDREMDYSNNRADWRQVAQAMWDQGFYSKLTMLIDVPVARIVAEAREIILEPR